MPADQDGPDFFDVQMAHLPGFQFIAKTEASPLSLVIEGGQPVDGPATHVTKVQRNMTREESATAAAAFFIFGARGDTKLFQRAVRELEEGLKNAQRG